MLDADEQARIREHFAAEPGKALHAERAHNELDNALAYGHVSDAERARAELAELGYQTRDERARAEAAAARSEAAAARKAERANGDADHKAPEGRSAVPPAKQTTAKPAAGK